MWQNSLNNYIHAPKNWGGFMEGIQTDYKELRDRRFNRNEWESRPRRLDAVGDEINRALNRITEID
jgi:hypothetical protein